MQVCTRRQKEVLSFISDHQKRFGHRPSYAIIARHLGLSSRAGIGRIVRDLETQGLITRRRENGHFYLDVGADNAQAPAGGVIVEWLDAPRPADKRDPWQDRPLVLPEFMLGPFSPENIRAYRVTDDGMYSENIREDDIALVELRQFVRDGDCVIAIVDRVRTVLRKYYRSGSDIELRPAGDRRDDGIIRLDADRVDVVAVYRTLLRPIL